MRGRMVAVPDAYPYKTPTSWPSSVRPGAGNQQPDKNNRMKKLKMLVMALLLAAVIDKTQAADATTSPNGFLSPQCTYGADMLTSSYGWNLKFSRTWGRDAYNWPSLLLNGTATSNPQAGDLMILDSWSGSAVGHVGWCWYRSGGWVRVISTNMKLGTDVLTYGGATFRAAWFYDLGNNTVYCWENGKTYPLKSFLTQR